jgi:hypothetical protein
MDVPLTIDLAGSRSSVRGYVIFDDRLDPYGKKPIPIGGHQKATHLRPFWRAAQRDGDALGLAVIRPQDVDKTAEQLFTHFVFPRDVDELFVGSKRIDTDELGGASVTVTSDSGVTFRRGGAFVGVRIPWARMADGGNAEIALVNDENPWGALRLTVTHGPSINAEVPPAAAIWVRIADGISESKAFAAWRQDFLRAQSSVTADAKGIAAEVQGASGPVGVAVGAPYRSGGRLMPAPRQAILTVDGEDLGQPILDSTAQLPSRKQSDRIVRISRAGEGYWEAEAGSIQAPMVAARDTDAAAISYVWMPGKVGARGGSVVGGVRWRLDIPRSSNYHLWARVRTPSGNDDSFFVRAFNPNGETVDASEWHTGVNEHWTWRRVVLDLSPEPTPLSLTKGLVDLELRVREDGAQLDALFLTTNPNASPPPG